MKNFEVIEQEIAEDVQHTMSSCEPGIRLFRRRLADLRRTEPEWEIERLIPSLPYLTLSVSAVQY
jgi:hypothetical protein